jgi:hypothetical protein
LRGTRVIAIDLSESRRAKIAKVVDKLGGVPGNGIFKTATIEEGKKIVADWTGGLGCNTALEVWKPPSMLRCYSIPIIILILDEFASKDCRS